ncbi:MULTISPECIES: hypothetical protein [unclassified Methylobacterium]|uniref:hypothetical protein n=1 Tax=unclassified Methylobacterium TaxID=2615210 RepID=UPI0011C1EF95|nr:MULTISPECIES: hypothetical protein [unclassified Methylobacterium]MCJ2118760.1 hypothetical protein [Methylobacterium sp. J-001]QEE41688.1 hypothetical protein FVA80_24820 [Methylobacterium sp. WL1]TXN01096.1 hypothetical protein FV242_19750 [Methylobacterium sp. WL64]TXN55409.1 hypothetical protein FV241_19965 [Methylobacterium sp. WL2]
MAGRRKVLSPDHIRALIKEAIGIIEGDHAIQAEAAAEIAALEVAHTSSNTKPRPKRSTRM